LDDGNIHTEDRVKAREEDKKLRNKLRRLWELYRQDQKSGDKSRIQKRKAEIDTLTKELIDAKTVQSTHPGNKPEFKD
jgi:uncharacterized protein (DUF2344 family)